MVAPQEKNSAENENNSRQRDSDPAQNIQPS